MKGIVTVFQSKRKRLSMHRTIQTSHLCLRCVEFFERMICRHIMFQVTVDCSHDLPIYRNILKDASIAFCANCTTPVSLHIKTASKNLGLGHRPISRPKSFLVNTMTFQTKVICCHHMSSFFSLRHTKNVLAPLPSTPSAY